MIIHISGPSGSGKTTLGDKIKKKFGQKIKVVDIDDLRATFVKKRYGGYNKIWATKDFKWSKKDYQEYIDAFVGKNKKPLVFVGLNHMPWWHKKHYYNMHSTHNFYIKISTDLVFKQKCALYLKNAFIDNQEQMIKDIKRNEKKTIKEYQDIFSEECSYKINKKMCDMWNKDYKKQKYKFMTREKIFSESCKLLNLKLKGKGNGKGK